MIVWNNGDSKISTLEKKTLKIYHVLEDLNYGILGIYAEFWKKIRKSTRRLSEEPYMARLRHLEKHIEAVPHALTPQQAQRSVDICRHLIGNPMDDRFIWRIATCDENGLITTTLTP